MVEQESTYALRVYTDGRLCVTAPLLRKYAEEAGLSKVPKRIYVRKTKAGWVLSWNQQGRTAKRHDLSVRDRVLFGRFPKTGEWEATVWQSHLSIEPKGKIAKRRTKRRSKKSSAVLTKGSLSKSAVLVQKVEDAISQETKTRVAQIIKSEFENASLMDLALTVGKAFPTMTIGDILKA